MITLAQITDTHLFADKNALMRGWPTWKSLQAVVQTVAEAQPDILLLTGDLADKGEGKAYRHLVELLDPLNIPIYSLPGNHDDGSKLASLLTGENFRSEKSFELAGWRTLLLDSVLVESQIGQGALSETSWQWLENQLETYVEQPTLIALHHHPLQTGIDWMDMMQLQESERFQALVARFAQVKLVIFGHIHAKFLQRLGTIDYHGTPSTCIQVATLDDENLPGFRLIHLNEDGTYHTQVQRVAFAST
jgi:3',5'-cyclic-AMP phosphodiesterase